MRTKVPFIIKTMHVIVINSFIASILFTIIMLGIFLTSLLTNGDNYPLFDLFTKVTVGSFTPGILHLNGDNYNVYFYKSVADIEFSKYPQPFTNIATFSLLLYMVAGIYLIRIFKKFIINVKEYRYFTDENVKLLRKLGFGIIILWLVHLIFKILFILLIVKNIKFENAKILTDVSFFNTSGLYLGLVVLIFSAIFNYGFKLQKNEELTI